MYKTTRYTCKQAILAEFGPLYDIYSTHDEGKIRETLEGLLHIMSATSVSHIIKALNSISYTTLTLCCSRTVFTSFAQ